MTKWDLIPMKGATLGIAKNNPKYFLKSIDNPETLCYNTSTNKRGEKQNERMDQD